MNGEPINKRLERLRRQKGLTAKAMAKTIGVAETTYREWEYGRGLKMPPFQKISEVLAVSVTELIIGEKVILQEFLDDLMEVEKQLQQVRAKLSAMI